MTFEESIRILYDAGVLYVFAFMTGAVVGSFLNVVIYRWPLGESLVKPGSHCPSCKTPIPWYWNIPVISWTLLMGTCQWCGARISIRYFLVEMAAGLWAVAALRVFGPGLEFLAYFIFFAAMLAGSVIDIDHRLLPDAITLGVVPLGIVMSLLPQSLAPEWPVTWIDSLAGIMIGAGLFYFVLKVHEMITGREGMGFGDVKLMAGFGAFLGYQALPAVIVFGSVAGILTWLAMALLKKADRSYALPFGPFLAAGAMFVILTRPWLVKYWIIIQWV